MATSVFDINSIDNIDIAKNNTSQWRPRVSLPVSGTNAPSDLVSQPLITFPFSGDTMVRMSAKCTAVNKSNKKIQFEDTKFRLIQTMANVLHVKHRLHPMTNIVVMFKITNYTGMFLNIIINGIDNSSIYFTMMYRKPKIDSGVMSKLIRANINYPVFVSRVTMWRPDGTVIDHDEGKIPELDKYLDTLITNEIKLKLELDQRSTVDVGPDVGPEWCDNV